MYKKLLLLAVLLMIFTVSCNKSKTVSSGDDITKPQSFNLISGELSYGGIHNLILDSFDATYPIQGLDNITRDEYNTMVRNMGYIVENFFGNIEKDSFISRALITFDELEAFNNNVLDINKALLEISDIEQEVGFNGMPYEIYSEFFLMAKESSKRKEGQIGILIPPAYPMQSHHDKVADADARGFKYEYSVAIDQKVGMSVAYYRASLVAAIFSAVKERELVANGQ